MAFALAGPLVADPLRVGVFGQDPPLSFVDEHGRLAGVDVDLAHALCAAIGADCKLVPSDWNGLIPSLAAHRLDFVVASLSITPARQRLVDFTRPYYRSTARFVAARGRFRDISPESAKGLRIGVRRGSTFDDYATRKMGATADILRYGSEPDALVDLLLGRIDLVLGDSTALTHSFLSASEGQGYEPIGDPQDIDLLGTGVGIAVAKGSNGLLERLDQAVGELMSSGALARIAQTWLGDSVQGQVDVPSPAPVTRSP